MSWPGRSPALRAGDRLGLGSVPQHQSALVLGDEPPSRAVVGTRLGTLHLHLNISRYSAGRWGIGVMGGAQPWLTTECVAGPNDRKMI
jgi:hypothetical protein